MKCSVQVLVPALPLSPLRSSTVGMQARNKARSVSIMHSSIIPRLCNSLPLKKHPSGVSLELTNPRSNVDWLLLQSWQIQPSTSPPKFPAYPPTQPPQQNKNCVQTLRLPQILPFVCRQHQIFLPHQNKFAAFR